MTPTSTQSGLTSELIERVQNLTHAEKAQLVGLMFNDEPTEEPGDVAKAWKAEIARRIAAVENGTMKTHTLNETMTFLRSVATEGRGQFR